MNPASRTPEGWSNRCPVCGECVTTEPSLPSSDAPCPTCGCLLWFDSRWAEKLSFLVPEAYLADLGGCTKHEAILCMVGSLVTAGALPTEISGDAERNVLNREHLSSTGIGRGVAVPHAKHAGLSHIVGCVARSNHGIEFGSVDGSPVHLLVLLLSPADQPGNHLRAMARISEWLRSEEPNML